MGLYGIQFLIVVGFALTTLETASPAPLVGFAGFCLGMAAMILGGFVVPMARTRVAATTVAESDVAVEWTAGYPVRARLRFLAGTLAVVGLVAGVPVCHLGWSAATAFPPSLLPPVVVATSLFSERTYRATPAGLELRRGTRWYATRHLLPWSRFDGFSVTGDAIVLHRALPRIDDRCRREDLGTDEDAVVAALEAHLDRRS